jgi:hypothetical protein
VVEEPRLAVFFILFEGDAEGVCNIDDLSIVLAEQNTDNPLGRVARHGAGMVVCY